MHQHSQRTWSDRATQLGRLVSEAKDDACSSEEIAALWASVHGIALEHLEVKFRNLSREDREDIAQSIALRLGLEPNKFGDPDKATAFIQTCARNEAIGLLRREAKRARAFTTLGCSDPDGLEDSRIPSTLERLIETEELRQLRAAIPHLSPVFRVVVEEHLGGDGSRIAQIAQKLNLADGTVKSRLHTARHRLADLCHPCSEEAVGRKRPA